MASSEYIKMWVWLNFLVFEVLWQIFVGLVVMECMERERDGEHENMEYEDTSGLESA